MDRKEGGHLQTLIRAIRTCGVTFNVWEVRNSQGKSKEYDWTSLTGRDRKRVLQVRHQYYLNSRTIHLSSHNILPQKMLPSKLSTIIGDVL